MAKDVRALRDEASEATSAGKHKRALAAYLELERLEPRDAQWPKRAAETYRRLNNNKNAIEAFNRSAERYAQNGFLVQAIAVCKLVLQIDPQHADTLRRLSIMNELIGAGPTRASTMAENNPALHENPNVAAIRQNRRTGADAINLPTEVEIEDGRRRRDSDGLRNKPSTTPPSVYDDARSPSMSRTKSRPIALIPGAALETVQLSKEVPESVLREKSTPGIHVIPIDDGYEVEAIADFQSGSITGVQMPLTIEVEPPDHAVDAEVEELAELDLADIEEIPLPEPRAIGIAAARALAATPLFAGLPSEALEALVENLTLVSLEPGETLFREGEHGDALYVVVEGELLVQSEGPPRVAMNKLGPGSFIGEVALLTDQARSATVTAQQTSELLRIDRVTLAHVLGSHGDLLRAVLRFVRDRLVDRWIRTSPLFRPFNDQERATLAARFNFLEIDPGTKLLGANSRPDGLYIVLAGQFIVQRGSVTIARLGPGDLIGETALLSGGVFKSDVIARGKSLALCLPANDFREVIMTHPHVLEYIGEQAE
ncbi:MAG: cyclic nucleotide-binding domain-containing protein, partial [Kofleriaceae bacterium]